MKPGVKYSETIQMETALLCRNVENLCCWKLVRLINFLSLYDFLFATKFIETQAFETDRLIFGNAVAGGLASWPQDRSGTRSSRDFSDSARGAELNFKLRGKKGIWNEKSFILRQGHRLGEPVSRRKSERARARAVWKPARETKRTGERDGTTPSAFRFSFDELGP